MEGKQQKTRRNYGSHHGPPQQIELNYKANLRFIFLFVNTSTSLKTFMLVDLYGQTYNSDLLN